MKKSWLPGLDSNSQPFGSQLGGIKLLVPRLVSLTSLIAVYPALELDGSWTEIPSIGPKNIREARASCERHCVHFLGPIIRQSGPLRCFPLLTTSRRRVRSSWQPREGS